MMNILLMFNQAIITNRYQSSTWKPYSLEKLCMAGLEFINEYSHLKSTQITMSTRTHNKFAISSFMSFIVLPIIKSTYCHGSAYQFIDSKMAAPLSPRRQRLRQFDVPTTSIHFNVLRMSHSPIFTGWASEPVAMFTPFHPRPVIK